MAYRNFMEYMCNAIDRQWIAAQAKAYYLLEDPAKKNFGRKEFLKIVLDLHAVSAKFNKMLNQFQENGRKNEKLIQ